MPSQIRKRSNAISESFALSVKRGQSWWFCGHSGHFFSHLTSRGHYCTHQHSYFLWNLPRLLTSHPSCSWLFLAKVCDKNQIFPASVTVSSWVGHFSSRLFLTPIFKLLLSSPTSPNTELLTSQSSVMLLALLLVLEVHFLLSEYCFLIVSIHILRFWLPLVKSARQLLMRESRRPQSTVSVSAWH